MNDSAQITVLVLGVGSHVSQGILKALDKSLLNLRVVGSCLEAQSEFLYFMDHACLQPLLEDGEEMFKQWLIALCREQQVQVILSGIEPVIHFLSRHQVEIQAATGARPIVATQEVLKIGQSKWATCEWLEQNGFAFPRYARWREEGLEGFAQQVGYPIMAKPVHGKGSQGIHLVRKAEDFALIREPERYIFQEYIGSDDTEYTVGCFRSPNTQLTDAIVMKRQLSRGFTYKAEIVEREDIAQECIRIVDCLGITGPCNIQLRLHGGKVCCFEINARFSGTTPIRAHYGFNDVEASIRHFLLGETGRLPKIVSGVAYRYWNEAYIDPAARRELLDRGSVEPKKFGANETDAFGMRR